MRKQQVPIVLVGLILAAGVTAADSVPPYLNPKLPIDQRVDDLVSRMTLQEKASQLVNQARAIPRLKVPAYDWWSEALHGVAFGIATVFPEPIGLGATFDTPLIHQMAIVIGTEGRAKHIMAVRAGRRDIMEGLDFWAPNVNIFRDPRWGRGQETYGEDPFLTGRMAIAYVTGMQGNDPKYLRVIATPKHYDVHSGPEPLRHKFDAIVSKHDEEDTYLPAFRAAIVEGKAQSVMCAYNSINGQPACANDFLLKDELRGKWNFHGYVVSDCGAVLDILNGHHYVKTLPEAAADAVKAGMDNECADFFAPVKGDSDYKRYVEAVQQGLLPEKDLDTAVKRLFRARFELGMFDPPSMVKYAQTPSSENDSPQHRQLALKAARETMVLLKNDGLLPLKPSVKKIAVVGPLADQIRVLEGNYHGTPSRATTALEGIRKEFPAAHVAFEPGTNFLRDPVTIPAGELVAPDGKPGLKAEFFTNPDFEGTPAVTRVDREVDYDMTNRSAVPRGLSNFSVRWTGFLQPTESGMWKVGVGGFMNRLYVDGKLIVNNMGPGAPGRGNAPELTLEKGHRYAVKLEASGRIGLFAKLEWTRVYPDALERAVAIAKDADVVIAVVGITSDLEGEEMNVHLPGFNGGDRTSLQIPKQEEDLLHAVKATGKPLAVVLMNGSALAVNWVNENADAILEAWYSGEEGGMAVGETLSGANNPAGRLPVTFYKSVDQLPPFTDYSMKNRTYRYFTGDPLYPFGYGLSYSKFEYSNPKLSTAALKAGEPLTVTADVKNASKRAGDEVVEVYLTFPRIPGAPIHALRAFTRVHIAAGATRRVELRLHPRDLSMVNDAGDRLIAAGNYSVTIGGGQPGTGAAGVSAPLRIEGQQRLPE
jgi:beta-glucosidase